MTIQHSLERLFKRDSAKAREALHLAKLVAPADISVLILGANGTGKESIARTIHFNSPRKDEPFVAVNCGAIPPELIASMFFRPCQRRFHRSGFRQKRIFRCRERRHSVP